jgi:glutathione-dependent peroxiredoxin
MTPIQTGQHVPDFILRTRRDGAWVDLSPADLFAGRRVVVFGLPGAFTPTCSASHVPRYNELQPAFAVNGIDDILCVSVNDWFVMDAWRRDQGADRITFIADGNGTLTDALGLLVDKSSLGFGSRSWRYAMVINDGVVEQTFIEPQVEGDPYGVSDADTVLGWLAPEAKPLDVVMVTAPGCSYCATGRSQLTSAGIDWEEVTASPRRLRALSGRSSTPQVFIDGVHIGGSDELARWLAAR